MYYVREPHCAYQHAPGDGKRPVSVVARDRAALADDPGFPKSFMMLLSDDELSKRLPQDVPLWRLPRFS